MVLKTLSRAVSCFRINLRTGPQDFACNVGITEKEYTSHGFRVFTFGKTIEALKLAAKLLELRYFL